MLMNLRSLFGEHPADPNPIPAKRIDEIDSDKPILVDIDCHAPSVAFRYAYGNGAADATPASRAVTLTRRVALGSLFPYAYRKATERAMARYRMDIFKAGT